MENSKKKEKKKPELFLEIVSIMNPEQYAQKFRDFNKSLNDEEVNVDKILQQVQNVFNNKLESRLTEIRERKTKFDKTVVILGQTILSDILIPSSVTLEHIKDVVNKMNHKGFNVEIQDYKIDKTTNFNLLFTLEEE